MIFCSGVALWHGRETIDSRLHFLYAFKGLKSSAFVTRHICAADSCIEGRRYAGYAFSYVSFKDKRRTDFLRYAISLLTKTNRCGQTRSCRIFNFAALVSRRVKEGKTHLFCLREILAKGSGHFATGTPSPGIC